MKRRMKKVIRVMLPVALSLLVSCATVPKTESPHEEFKANLGTIGVVSASFQPEVRLEKPMEKGSAALHFAGKGAGVGLWVAAQGGNVGPAAFVALGFVPLGAAIGSIVGLAKGVPYTEIKEAEKTLKSYLATVNFQETMREHFLSVAGEQTRYPFVPLDVQGPKTPDEEVTYSFLSESGIDTVFEISVYKCELFNRDKNRGVNPHLYLGLTAGIKLIRVADGKVIYSEKFVDHWSNSLKFSDWDANDAEPFREGLDHAFQYLAGRMVDRLTGIQAPVDPEPSSIHRVECIWPGFSHRDASADKRLPGQILRRRLIICLTNATYLDIDTPRMAHPEKLNPFREGSEKQRVLLTRRQSSCGMMNQWQGLPFRLL